MEEERGFGFFGPGCEWIWWVIIILIVVCLFFPGLFVGHGYKH